MYNFENKYMGVNNICDLSTYIIGLLSNFSTQCALKEK